MKPVIVIAAHSAAACVAAAMTGIQISGVIIVTMSINSNNAAAEHIPEPHAEGAEELQAQPQRLARDLKRLQKHGLGRLIISGVKLGCS